MALRNTNNKIAVVHPITVLLVFRFVGEGEGGVVRIREVMAINLRYEYRFFCKVLTNLSPTLSIIQFCAVSNVQCSSDHNINGEPKTPLRKMEKCSRWGLQDRTYSRMYSLPTHTSPTSQNCQAKQAPSPFLRNKCVTVTSRRQNTPPRN